MTAPAPVENLRVYAILLTDDSKVLLIKRAHRGFPPYWVAAGGAVLSGEQPDAALARILDAELDATALILQRAFELELGDLGRHIYYVCRLQTYNYPMRGPQTADPVRTALSTPEFISLVCDSLRERDVYPLELSAFLLARCP